MKKEILLVEDDQTLAASLERVLSVAGYSVTTVVDGTVGLERAREGQFSAVVTDFKLPELSGLELVKQISAGSRRTPIILMTAHSCAELAIEAIRWGAYDYLTKPFEMQDLLAMLENVVAQNLSSPSIALVNDQEHSASLIGQSPAMQAVYKEIGRVAATSAGVLIQGESGSGKELVARAIWRHSDRAAKPFIAVNCTAIPETLVESEMFGYERGSFTGAQARRLGQFELAQGGTIFLDEIGDMTLQTQAKLLRVLQERTIRPIGGREPISIDVRVIAATHRDLAAAVRDKEFREDLFYRLSVACIRLPPLRKRVEDVPQIVEHFLQAKSREMRISAPPIQKEAIEFLQGHPWPGNVRELENAIQRALLIRPGYPITVSDIRYAVDLSPSTGESSAESITGLINEKLNRAARGESTGAYAETMSALERELILRAIKLSRGNQLRAARLLGISRFTLRQRLRSLGFDPAALKTQFG
jgi:DNA-binding NtrC family response regulator